MIENRLVGVKSRECYEVPGAPRAHPGAQGARGPRASSASVLHYKLGIEQTWAELAVYNGLWFSPLKEALDAFMASTQQLPDRHGASCSFYKGSCTVVGRKSAYSLYDYGAGHLRRGRRIRPHGRQGLHQAADALRQDVGLEPPAGGRPG